MQGKAWKRPGKEKRGEVGREWGKCRKGKEEGKRESKKEKKKERKRKKNTSKDVHESKSNQFSVGTDMISIINTKLFTHCHCFHKTKKSQN